MILHALADALKPIFDPSQLIDNKASAKGKITFETSKNISNVVFLRSYVRYRACGRFFQLRANDVPAKWIIRLFSILACCMRRDFSECIIYRIKGVGWEAYQRGVEELEREDDCFHDCVPAGGGEA